MPRDIAYNQAQATVVVNGLLVDNLADGDSIRIINDAVKAEMGKILDEIRSGKFAEEWIAENRAGRARFEELRAAGKEHPIEKVGAELRAMMPFISAGKTRPEDVSGG